VSLPDVISTALREKLAKIVRIFVAVGLLIVGAIGMIVPFLHGLSFFLAGAIILSFDFPRVERLLKRYISKHRGVEKLYNALYEYLRKRFK
jgi:uncharacterized membrane protein YbaN (DUF454 family)